MQRLFLILLVLLTPLILAPGVASAADETTWSARLEPADARAGEAAQVVIEARIEAPWYLYSLTRYEASPAPEATTITLVDGSPLEAMGEPVQPPAVRKMDEGFGIETEHFSGAVAFGLPVRIAEGTTGLQQVSVRVRFQICKEGLCMPARPQTVEFEFTPAPGEARRDRQRAITAAPEQPAGYIAPGAERSAEPKGAVTPEDAAARIEQARSSGLFQYLLLAFGMGLLALLTPCVFPMIPVTISYFSKQQETGGVKPVSLALTYCIGIIVTFCGLGLLVTALFGASGISRLATNPIVNLALALLFVVLALNLFGVFEIGVPQGLLQGLQTRSSATSRLVGPLFLGLAFSLSSFTCTVPFVGSLLAAAAAGDWAWPVLGMVAFSLAFASPFFLLSLFPQYLNRLPRSGAWLVVVKATMGFLELAAALKFFSNAEMVWGMGLLTRPVFVGIWFALFTMTGLYLLGWMRLPHSGGESIGLIRRGLGVLTLVFAVWVLGAADGRRIGELTALLPPEPYPGRASARTAGSIRWLHTWDEAVTKAREEKKLIFINFTGVTCTNCRLMEAYTLPDPRVVEAIGDMVAVELFTDKQTPESEAYQALEERLLGTVALPVYAVVTPDEEVLGRFDGMTRNAASFAEFIKAARQSGAEKLSASR